MKFINVQGGLLTAHFSHRDPLETCLAFRQKYGELFGLQSIPHDESNDVMLMLASQFGEQHEQDVIAELSEKYGDGLCRIGGQTDDAQKEEQYILTLQAMDEGKQLIHSGFLKMSGRSADWADEVEQRFGLPAPVNLWGEPDLLRRVDHLKCGSRFGDYYYEVADVKCSRTSKLPARLQVAFYSVLLADLQGFSPELGYVLPRSRNPDEGSVTRWEPFQIESVLPIAELFIREEYWRIVLADPDQHVSTTGYSKPLSKHWAESNGLFGESLGESDICLLPKMRLPVRRRLLSRKVHNIDSLSRLSDEELDACAGPGATAEGLKKQRTQAQVCVSGRPLWRDAHRPDLQSIVNSVTSNQDFGTLDFLQIDNANVPIVHFDIEGHPFREIEYLWGYQIDLPGDRPRPADAYEPVKQIWAETPTENEEQKAFETFLSQMELIEEEYGDLIIIHYATYEATRLNMLAERYAISLDGRDNRRRVERLSRRLLDLYRVLQRGFYLPFASYSIKDVAPGLARLPSPGGPGTEHCWLRIEDLETLKTRLSQDGWSDSEAFQGVETLARTARVKQMDVSELLDASASMSVFWYEQYCLDREPIWRHLINLYNADDLVATQRLYDYLLRLHRNGLEGIERAASMEKGEATA